MKILNLECGIGGNRKLWDKPLKEKFGDNYKIVAVELNPEIAAIYKDFFPNDEVIVTDAHQYLLEHFKEFDFIWSSPPCPTHSRARFWGWSNKKPVYPDLTLYQRYIFLKHHFKGKFVIENVIPYYDYLIHPNIILGRHAFWSNFQIPFRNFKSDDIRKYSGTSKKDKMIRNKVDYEIGLYILNRALDIKQANNTQQKTIFDDL